MLLSPEEIKQIDPAKEPQKFYYEWGKRMVTLNTAERLGILEHSAASRHVSELNEACHSFAEGMIGIYSSDFNKAFDQLLRANELFQKLQHKGGQMAVNIMLCTCHRSMGQLDKAHDRIQQALQLIPFVDQTADGIYGHFKAIAYYQAAEVNSELKNYESALEIFRHGLSLQDGSIVHQGRLLSGMGVVFMNLERWEEAKEHLEKALKSIEGEDNLVLESKILADLGMYYFRTNDYDLSFQNQEKSLNMRLSRNMQSPAITNYIRLAELCLASGKKEEALKYGEIAAGQADKINLHIKLYEAHKILSEIHESMGNIPKAFAHFKLYSQFREEVHGQEVIRKVEQLRGQYKIESAQQEKEIFRLRNVELKSALGEIKESFRYAKRIQTAILPPDKLISQAFPESFVLFMPKDIVSGDFYWMMETADHKLLIAAVDCTGHGVPGAMVSMVGYNCLNRSVHAFGLTAPNEILNKLTELVEGTFSQGEIFSENNEDKIRDGMDISIACIDLKNKKLEWAGANNPLWMIRNGELAEFTADKQPVGKYDHRHPFTNHSIDLQPGDAFYFFTDGYADQFGGPHGKKFKYKQLKELLIATAAGSMQTQKESLSSRFDEWKGEMEQVDDVLIIGLKV